MPSGTPVPPATPMGQDIAQPSGGDARAAEGAAAPAKHGGRRSIDARALVGKYAVVLALIAMIVGFSIALPDTFFTVANLKQVLLTQAVLVILSLGLIIALAAGEFDLSIAALVGFSAAFLAHLTSQLHWAVLPALLVAFLVAFIIGAVNAIFVVGFGVNSFITTLGSASVITGVATAITGSTTIGNIPDALTKPFSGQLLGIGLPVFYALALAVVLWFFLEHTPSGRYLFFTGEGREASRLAGVRVNRIRAGALISSALFACLAGVVLLGQTGAADPTFGQPLLLPAFAAGFLGATTIKTGRYNAWGTVVAVYLLAVGTTGLQQLGAADWVTNVFNGGALVIAVTIARLASRERS